MDKRVLEVIDIHLSGDIKKAKGFYKNLLIEDNLSSEDFEAININLGNIYFLEKNYLEAREYYEKSLSYNSQNEKIFFNTAMTFFQNEELEKAKEYFQKAIDINPEYLNAYVNLGVLNKKLELLDESIVCFEKALDIDPSQADIYYNYANIFLKKEQYNAALVFFKNALELKSNDIYKIYYSIGLTFQFQNKYDEALNYFNKTLQLKKDYADAHFAKATILLINGDFENGWKEYEYRWDASNELKRPQYDVKWLKNLDNIKNKRILVQQEQGYGDNIQFVRYVTKLVELGVDVYLAVREPLYRLFSTIQNIKLLKDNEVVENVDYFTSLMDLPRIFYHIQNEFLYKENYFSFFVEDIFVPKNKDKLNIGFVWRGNPIHKGDKKRSINLSNFELLFENNNIDFYSLQYENSDELEEYKKSYNNIYDCKSLINDFNDTANVVSKLDLVITIDSSMVHLCGALGIKTYLILGKNSEWRWLLNTEESIWYKSLKIFRQDNKDWNKVFKNINSSLQKK